MAVVQVTFNDIYDALSPDEQEELLRPDFKVPLELYLKGFNRYPLSNKSDLIEKFRTRARRRISVKNEVARNPDVQKTEFKDPIVIIGLPRSGTTMLHRLLLTDPQFIGPMAWEMIAPLPPGRPENWQECERLKRASQDAELGAFSNGVIDNRHYFRMDSPEECFVILRQYFLDFIEPIPIPHMTELRDFMYHFPEEHATNAYEFLKMCLQCMYCGNMGPGKTLLLKCPIHPLYLDTMKKVFPTAKFIFPYRSGKAMVASYSSFVDEVWKVHSSTNDNIGAGKRVTEFFKYSSARAVKFLKQLPQDDYISLPYTEMITNPMDTIDQIYSHFNLSLAPEIAELLQSHLKENSQHKYGKVSYKAEDYGITDQVIKENMKEYLDYFADGTENLL